MPLKDDVLNTQLTRAKAALAVADKELQGQTGKKNALWRRANSRVKQIEGRLQTRQDIRSGKAEAAAEEAPAEAAE